MSDSKVPPALVKSLSALFVMAGLGSGSYYAGKATEAAQRDEYVQTVAADPETSAGVKVAMVMGSYYESSGKHIGTPYIDRNGKGEPLTVCNGVTGPAVVPGKWYGPGDCYRLERARYIQAERDASRLLVRWSTYDPFVQGTFIDFTWNKGAANLASSTMLRRANAGDLEGACRENPRWNRGTVKGVSTVLPGLQTRGDSNDEICRSWRVTR